MPEPDPSSPCRTWPPRPAGSRTPPCWSRTPPPGPPCRPCRAPQSGVRVHRRRHRHARDARRHELQNRHLRRRVLHRHTVRVQVQVALLLHNLLVGVVQGGRTAPSPRTSGACPSACGTSPQSPPSARTGCTPAGRSCSCRPSTFLCFSLRVLIHDGKERSKILFIQKKKHCWFFEKR